MKMTIKKKTRDTQLNKMKIKIRNIQIQFSCFVGTNTIIINRYNLSTCTHSM